jgi:hypothetical protein
VSLVEQKAESLAENSVALWVVPKVVQLVDHLVVQKADLKVERRAVAKVE